MKLLDKYKSELSWIYLANDSEISQKMLESVEKSI